MIDRETIMTWLKKCGNGGCSSRCPYDDLGPDKCYETLMTDALELLRKHPQWIRVEDRMPPELHSMWFTLYGTSKWKSAMWREESDHVLVTVVFDDGTRYVSMGRTHDGEWNTNISKVVHHAVTHWMPLPEPPEEVMPDEQ